MMNILRSRWPLWLGLALNLGVTLWSIGVLPERVAMHFGGSGDPTRFGSREGWVAVQLAITVGLASMMASLPWLCLKLPADLVNVPRREFWLQPALRPHFAQRMTRSLDHFTLGLFVFLAFVQLQAVLAHGGEPVRMALLPFYVALGLFMAGTAWWCWSLTRSFRNPEPELEALDERKATV